MRYREYSPDPRLRAHVACYWSLVTDGTAQHLVLPDGCMDLLFEDAGISLVGAMTAATTVRDDRAARTFGVRFRPGEAFAFTRIAASEVCDQLVPLRDVWGREADALAMPERDDQRVAYLDRVLLARRTAAADRRVRRGVTAILAEPATRVDAIAREVGLGVRQLERAFEVRVGVGPKALARVARLHALVARLGEPATWTERAAAVGFADQAHLVRDVRRLSGLTPTALAGADVWPIAI